MNFNPLAQFNSFDSEDDDDTNTSPPPMALQPASPNAMAIPLMQANGRMARSGMLDGAFEEDSELSENEDSVPEPVQFTVKHLKQQRQSVLAFNAGGPNHGGQPDPKQAMEIIALNQKIQSLQVLLDKSRNKARQQAVDLEDAEDRVTQLEDEVQQLNDKVRQRDHAISNMEFELQRAQKKDRFEGLEQQGFSDKLKLFQSKIAMNSLDGGNFRKPPLGQKPSFPPQQHTPTQRTGSIGMANNLNNNNSGDNFAPRSSLVNSSSSSSIATPPPPPAEPKTITITETVVEKVVETVVDETKVKQLEEQVSLLQDKVNLLQQELALKQPMVDQQNSNNTTEPTVSQAEFMALGEELHSYQQQVEKLQELCKEYEEMLKQNQETIQNERLSLKDAKDEWYIEEQRLLTMIDDLHTSMQQTSVDMREYKEQIVALKTQNADHQQRFIEMIQQKNRPTISLPPTPMSTPQTTPLFPTVEVEEIVVGLPLQPLVEQSSGPCPTSSSQPPPIPPSPHHEHDDEPKQIAPLVIITKDDDDDDDEQAPPPPTTPRPSSAGVRPTITIDQLTTKPIPGPPPTPTAAVVRPPPTPKSIVEQQQQQQPVAVVEESVVVVPASVAPITSQPEPVTPATAPTNGEQVYEENVDDGELITKGLLTKLGIDSNNKPSSKRHFFALFATKTEYSEYYGTHVKSACELRWGRQESDYTSYPYGATVTNAFVAAQAITYLRQQGTNGQTLAAMVRPEDVARLLVMSTVDGRYVLLMCRDSEKGSATGAERALVWCESVVLAIKKNLDALGLKNDDDDEDDLHMPMVSSPLQQQEQQQQQSPQQQQYTPQPSPKPSVSGPPPIMPHHRESTIAPLVPLTPKMNNQAQGPESLRLSGSTSFSSGGSTPSLGPAPSPAHFMTRPLMSPQVGGSVSAEPKILPPMKGTLTKFIHNGKSWHTKYFSLTSTSGVIQWGDAPTKYKYHEFVKSVLRGQDKDLRIDPKAMKKANFFYNPDLMFSVQTTGKTLYLMAPTEESLNEWIDALERALFNQTQGR